MFGTHSSVVLCTSVRKTMDLLWFILKNILLFEPSLTNKQINIYKNQFASFSI